LVSDHRNLLIFGDAAAAKRLVNERGHRSGYKAVFEISMEDINKADCLPDLKGDMIWEYLKLLYWG
jgi:hypothetical protein